MRKLTTGLMTVSIATLALASLHSQAPAYGSDQQRTLQLLDAISQSLPTNVATATHIGWLRKSIESRPDARLPQSMIRGLEANLTALDSTKRLTAADRDRLINAVREDLQLKAEYCRTHPEGMAAQITLRVRTWQPVSQRIEAPAWQVMYINAPLAGFPGRTADPFPQHSSPTALALPPGAYLIWAQDPKAEARRGPAVTVRLGKGAEKTLDADLLVAPAQ